MTRKRFGFLVVVIVAISAAYPRVVQGQRTGVEIWAATCGNCHITQPANRYTAKDWDAIGTHMVITARLTDAQANAVLEFLKANAARPEGGGANGNAVPTASAPQVQRSGAGGLAAQELEPKEQFRKLCTPCHGAAGRGDGPAAVALTPKPGNFTDPGFQASRTDEQLVAVIADGKPPMPGFGKQLSDSDIKALVAYIRELGKKPK